MQMFLIYVYCPVCEVVAQSLDWNWPYCKKNYMHLALSGPTKQQALQNPHQRNLVNNIKSQHNPHQRNIVNNTKTIFDEFNNSKLSIILQPYTNS